MLGKYFLKQKFKVFTITFFAEPGVEKGPLPSPDRLTIIPGFAVSRSKSCPDLLCLLGAEGSSTSLCVYGPLLHLPRSTYVWGLVRGERHGESFSV